MTLPRADRRGAGARRSRGARAVLCLALGGAAVACASTQTNKTPVVTKLTITGNHTLSSRQIERKIVTAATGWWPFAQKQRFDPVTWQSDLKRIERLYVASGFYQAEVMKADVVAKPSNKVALDVHVSEGPRTRVGTVAISGLDAVAAPDRDAVLARLPLAAGAPFVESAWEAGKQQIVTRLRARGYAKAAVAGRALVDVKTHLAALTLAVRPGLRYAFGAIEVDTAPGARLPSVLIWEQVRLAIPTGRRYSEEALDEAQRRVLAMGVFSSVKVAAGDADDATALIPVRVDAREAPFRTLRLGVGATIDQIRNEALLLGDWTNRNFHGGMRKLTVHAEAGWAFIPSLFAVASGQSTTEARDGPIARASVQFEQPRFLAHPSLREQSEVEADRTLEQTYDALAARLSNGVVWQPRARLSIFPSYHIEGDYLNGPPISSAATAPLTLGCATSSDHCFVWLSYLEQVVTWDQRDQPLEPRNGFYASLSLQEGGGPLGGDFAYFRVLPDVRGYVSFGDSKGLTLAARVRVGELWPASGNPEDSAVVTRFYAGGAVSMRGFSDRRLSPLLLVPPPPGTSNVSFTIPIGGDGMLDASVEARYSLTAALRLATFVDAGQVTIGQIRPDDAAHALVAVGIGIRYLTAIGPIRVDLARRLPVGRLPPLYAADATTGAIVQQPPYAVDQSCFGLFASQPSTPVTDGACVLQVSIGEAF